MCAYILEKGGRRNARGHALECLDTLNGKNWWLLEKIAFKFVNLL
jgi:hypothetical protein